jgi:hypothetical protein
MAMTKFEFDYVEVNGRDALQEVKEAAELCEGYIAAYEKFGPGGGNPWFEVEVEHGGMFEVWLKSKGFDDPEEYRA